MSSRPMIRALLASRFAWSRRTASAADCRTRCVLRCASRTTVASWRSASATRRSAWRSSSATRLCSSRSASSASCHSRRVASSRSSGVAIGFFERRRLAGGRSVPMILRDLFEVSSATADSAAPSCRHAHICCRRGNGDGFDYRALCGAVLHDGP